jgi:uncharacterized protein YkwD
MSDELSWPAMLRLASQLSGTGAERASKRSGKLATNKTAESAAKAHASQK